MRVRTLADDDDDAVDFSFLYTLPRWARESLECSGLKKSAGMFGATAGWEEGYPAGLSLEFFELWCGEDTRCLYSMSHLLRCFTVPSLEPAALFARYIPPASLYALTLFTLGHAVFHLFDASGLEVTTLKVRRQWLCTRQSLPTSTQHKISSYFFLSVFLFQTSSRNNTNSNHSRSTSYPNKLTHSCINYYIQCIISIV